MNKQILSDLIRARDEQCEIEIKYGPKGVRMRCKVRAVYEGADLVDLTETIGQKECAHRYQIRDIKAVRFPESAEVSLVPHGPPEV